MWPLSQAVFSRFMYIVAYISTAFFLWQHPIVRTYHILLIPQLVDIWVVSAVAVVTQAAVNIHVLGFTWAHSFSWVHTLERNCWVIWILSEKAMAPHSSTLARKIPWMEEPGRLQSMGSLRVRHDWATSLSLFTFMHWRRKWRPTPVFLSGESQGRGSLVGFRLWGRIESDTTEVT